jgi:ketosteroid isomerase-like protein
MSQENVQLVRRGYEALSSMDAEAMVLLCDSAVTFESQITVVDGATYHGPDGVRRFVRELEGAFDWIELELLEIIDGGDRIVVLNRLRARGARSGAQVEQRFFQAVTIRDGRALWWSFFDSKAKALEAVGLEE